MSTFVGSNDVYAHVRFCINVAMSLAENNNSEILMIVIQKQHAKANG